MHIKEKLSYDDFLDNFVENNVTEIDMDFQDMTEEDRAILIFRNSTY
tara:strand:+ start:340 stop:480 length:141 start_codon:yes stop_codon:yes gene_type:complete